MKLAPSKMPHCGTAASPGTDMPGKIVLAPHLPRSPDWSESHVEAWPEEGKGQIEAGNRGGPSVCVTRADSVAGTPASSEDLPPAPLHPSLPHGSPSGQEGHKRIQKLAAILCFQFNY